MRTRVSEITGWPSGTIDVDAPGDALCRKEVSVVTSFLGRMIGAAKLDVGIYEEVEADSTATVQAMGVVVLSSLATGVGVGSAALGVGVIAGVVAALLSWVIWAFLTYLIGTRLLPEPQTHADMGQMMRTLGFAQSPGLLRIFGGLPGIGPLLLGIVSVWMLVAMVIAVRQALDYTTTWRAAVVCLVAWLAVIVPAVLILGLMGAVAGG